MKTIPNTSAKASTAAPAPVPTLGARISLTGSCRAFSATDGRHPGDQRQDLEDEAPYETEEEPSPHQEQDDDVESRQTHSRLLVAAQKMVNELAKRTEAGKPKPAFLPRDGPGTSAARSRSFAASMSLSRHGDGPKLRTTRPLAESTDWPRHGRSESAETEAAADGQIGGGSLTR
jgi:hypothetical protein